MVTEQVTKVSSMGSLPSVNASKIDWPNESTEMHWPSVVCRAQGLGPITLGRWEWPGTLRGGSGHFQLGRSREALSGWWHLGEAWKDES